MTTLLLAEAAQATHDSPWWQIAGAILALPTALLAIFQAMLLLKKTWLEIKKLDDESAQRRNAVTWEPGDGLTHITTVLRHVLGFVVVMANLVQLLGGIAAVVYAAQADLTREIASRLGYQYELFATVACVLIAAIWIVVPGIVLSSGKEKIVWQVLAGIAGVIVIAKVDWTPVIASELGLSASNFTLAACALLGTSWIILPIATASFLED
jgi:hypothetical protein